MGCICSKHVARSYSSLGSSAIKNNDHNISHPLGLLKRIKNGIKDDNNDDDHEISKVKGNHVVVDNQDGEFSNYDSINLKFGRLTEAEHVAAGWPSWLSAVAGEAIDGWLPLKSINFERFEKIGQGAYSSVYRGCHTEGGRMVALKKVRFDNLKPDSVKFMAREITILRKLDHPNIMKLEGIITSELSCDIYLVFEYMEHDLSGLLSNPDIKFSDSQIKCYMRQLLKGIEHCHSLGILHRDIKTANILVNSKGILKIGDFGLAKFLRPKSREPLTSHVVTLWYRPPELLLGCTRYGTYVDLWSVGCVLAELFLGKPILKGQTEVEQLHKIFKLCGTPPDDYWNKSRLPLAGMYKPHHAYESSLRERCKQLPETAVNLIDTLLSIEPCKRGSARSALESEYFNTKPYACDIASLPKYPPNRDIHAKETCRNKPGGIVWGSSKNPTRNLKTCQEQTSLCKVVPTEVNADAHIASGTNGGGAYSRSSRGFVDCRGSSKALCDTMLEFSHTNEGYQSDAISALPIQATASAGSFMWAAGRRKYDGIPTHNGAPVVVRSASKRMPENGESTSRVWSGLKNCRVRSLNQHDSSKVQNSQDLPSDEEEIFFDARSQLTQ